jgi:hypothetical protein
MQSVDYKRKVFDCREMQLAPWDNEYNQAKYDEADGNEDVPNNGSVMLNKINSTDYMTMTKDDKVSDISEWFCDQVMHGNQYLKCRTGLVDPTNQQFTSQIHQIFCLIFHKWGMSILSKILQNGAF